VDFVLDASVAMGWLLRSQATPLTMAARNALADNTGWIPQHFGIEVLRSLRGQERRGLMTSAMVDDALAHLGELPMRQDLIETLEVLAPILVLARRHRLRVSDAAYLELALRTGLPLATRNAALAAAARAAGANVFAA